MEMSKNEIVDKYKRCGVSVGILAQLNVCGKEDIIGILEEAGAYKQPKKRGRAAKQQAADHADNNTPEKKRQELIFNIVAEKLDKIEADIRYHTEKIKELEAEYTELAAAIGTIKEA